ncbi:rRNA maturation RNase YbeY [Arcobacteraceae bacterium]|nr:rRNA maturation RNase YbeY [Arcobacteraceae bacterium]
MSNIVFENNTENKIDLGLIQEILSSLSDKEIELILTDNEEMQEINLNTRGFDKPTDVLSFPYDDMPNVPLGSIVISIDFVIEKSKLFNHSLQDEFTLLFIHGILHLLGYDHEVDNGEHRDKEEELITKYHLPKSLIIRTGEE